MQTSLIAILGFIATTVTASPTGGQPAAICPVGLFSVPQCCATDVLGVADLDCASPPSFPQNTQDFKNTCASIGQRARCCVLPVLGQGVLCETPPGLGGQ
ncbi:hydrophobin-like protein [Xylaria arbuscula]|nr:hydrophobin-like protein [Xylaria arbuscula]